MTVYPLYAHCLAGDSDSASAHLRRMRQRTDDNSQPPASAPADRQKWHSKAGAGAKCNGKQQRSDRVCPSSQAAQADASQRGSRDRTNPSHTAQHNGCCEKVSTGRSTQERAHPVHTDPQNQRVHDSTPRQSESESESGSQCDSGNENQSEGESESSSESSGAEGSGKSHVPTGGKHGAAGHARQAAFERLDSIFSDASSGKTSLKRKVDQASCQHTQ